jgi:hypothetical protein
VIHNSFFLYYSWLIIKNIKRYFISSIMTFLLLFIFLNYNYSEKRWLEHPSVKYTILSKYLALPIATFPKNCFRVKSALIRHLLPRHESSLPIKLLTLYILLFGLLWFEHNNSSTQMRRLTNLALTRLVREYPIRTDVIF